MGALFSKGSEAIKKSCKYCGKIHEENYNCKNKPVKKKRIDESVHFRNSQSWQNKRKEIRERDNYLCQICIRNLYNTERKYNYENLQVHHAVPLNSDKTLKLDDSNLITLCEYHHYLCDHGDIPYAEVKKIIDEQENKNNEQRIMQCRSVALIVHYYVFTVNWHAPPLPTECLYKINKNAIRSTSIYNEDTKRDFLEARSPRRQSAY